VFRLIVPRRARLLVFSSVVRVRGNERARRAHATKRSAATLLSSANRAELLQLACAITPAVRAPGGEWASETRAINYRFPRRRVRLRRGTVYSPPARPANTIPTDSRSRKSRVWYVADNGDCRKRRDVRTV